MRLNLGPNGLTRLIAAENGGLLLWLPPCLGGGIALYFALGVEPPFWVGPTVCGAALAMALRGWRSRWRPLLAGMLAVSVGLAAAQIRTDGLAHTPVLSKPTRPLPVTGTIAYLEPGPGRARVILSDVTVPGTPAAQAPARVRLSLRDPSGTLGNGDRIRVLAVLRPPPPPIMPGAYDFQRQAFFDGIGAYGYALGPPAVLETGPGGTIGDLRRAVTARVHGIAPDSQAAAVAAALLSGHRGYIGDETYAVLRDAGIAHLLAISGLHIGLIAGLMFGAVRIGVALTPGLAHRIDGKKLAAVLAMAAASAYAVLAGFTVPTERALIMTWLVLAGVLIDRRTLSLRTVALAAGAILISTPESLIGPGFQMSFAAVTALIAVHAFIRARRGRVGDAGRKGPLRRAVRYLGGVSLMTLIASAATAPFAIHHFQHVSTLGVVANLCAVPMAALWIMPAGLAAMLAMPFGLDAAFLHAMIAGTHAMLWVAGAVASWPGTAADIPAPPVWGIASVALGGLLLALLKTRLRLIGAPVLALGYLAPLTATAPDIVVDGQARVVAVKGAAGTLMLSSNRVGRFETAGWRRRAGDRTDADWPDDPERPLDGLRCDGRGCLLTREGIVIGIAFDGLALDDDCRGADMLVSLEPLPRRCRPPMGRIDRFSLWRGGTHAIWVESDGSVRIVSVNEERGRRPWVLAPGRDDQ